MPVAAPDWGALAGQLEQLLPHLAEARTAKAQLYQIGILNSQLLQAGSSGGAPTSEDERQRMLGCELCLLLLEPLAVMQPSTS